MRTLRHRRGFSLVELMVVVAIIGLLATVVALNLGGASEKAKKEKVKADLSKIRDAIMLFKEDCHKYPNDVRDLMEDPGMDGWGETTGGDSYLDSDPVDPWGADYVFHSSDPVGNKRFNLCSYGADGVDGGDGENEDIWLYPGS